MRIVGLHVGEQSSLVGPPAERIYGSDSLDAGLSSPTKWRDHAEMLWLLSPPATADSGDLEPGRDQPRDVAEGHAVFIDPVELRPRFAPPRWRGCKASPRPNDARPAIGSRRRRCKRKTPFSARGGDDVGDEAMLAGAVDGRGKPHDRRANPLPDKGREPPPRRTTGSGSPEGVIVALVRDSALRQGKSAPRRRPADVQKSLRDLRPGRRSPPFPFAEDPEEARDHAAIQRSGEPSEARRQTHVGQPVDESDMDNAVRLRGACASDHARQACRRAPSAPRRLQLSCALNVVKPTTSMSRRDQILDDGRTDPAGRAGDEYAHEIGLRIWLETNLGSGLL